MPTRTEVADFLSQFKSCVSLGLCTVKDREKNRQGLIDLGITAQERRDVLLGLQPEDYMDGPKPDDTDDTKEIWEFGAIVGDKEAYIKVRVVQLSTNRYHALVWSFHPAEFPMRYPLRQREVDNE